jgi:hypothetical protein
MTTLPLSPGSESRTDECAGFNLLERDKEAQTRDVNLGKIVAQIG